MSAPDGDSSSEPLSALQLHDEQDDGRRDSRSNDSSVSDSGASLPNSRHASAPLRPPPALYVPLDRYNAVIQPIAYSCTHADEDMRLQQQQQLQEELQEEHRQRMSDRAILAAQTHALQQLQLQQQQEQEQAQEQLQQSIDLLDSASRSAAAPSSHFSDEEGEALDPEHVQLQQQHPQPEHEPADEAGYDDSIGSDSGSDSGLADDEPIETIEAGEDGLLDI